MKMSYRNMGIEIVAVSPLTGIYGKTSEGELSSRE